MDLIAHRGATLVKQENSVESLEYAARIGAAAAECDIRQMSDGVFVIYHDEGLGRLCNYSCNYSCNRSYRMLFRYSRGVMCVSSLKIFPK